MADSNSTKSEPKKTNGETRKKAKTTIGKIDTATISKDESNNLKGLLKIIQFQPLMKSFFWKRLGCCCVNTA